MKDSIFGNFALFCSGANQKILSRKRCRTERTKYKMIGIFVFLTAVFATLSGGYALYTGFKSVWLAIIAGLLWGAFIFNTDRFIISTIRKKDISPDSTTYEKIYLKAGEVLAAVPRIVFAVFISIVITAPLELKYFEPEINAYIEQEHRKAEVNRKNLIPEQVQEIATLQQNNKTLRESLEKKETLCVQLYNSFIEEVEGTGGTRRKGKGPVYEEKREASDQCQKDLKELKTQVSESNEKLEQRMAEQEGKEVKVSEMERKGDGFLARLSALHELSSVSGPVGWVSFFISMLFILMETTPIFMKVMSKRGPYDCLLDVKEHAVYLKSLKEISDMNEQMNTEIENNALKAEVEKQMMRDALNNLPNFAQTDSEDAQAEVVKTVIQNWKGKNIPSIPVAITP